MLYGNNGFTHSIASDNTQFFQNVESDAWPETQQAQVKSKIHKIIREQINQIDPKKLYFDRIDPESMDEVRSLHEEWFPLNYPDSFYDKIYNKHDFISLGCYIDLRKQGSKRKSKVYKALLGLILCRIQHGKEEINEIYFAKDEQRGGLLGWFQNAIVCREYQGAYIATLGVIDECRRLGIGTMLLNELTKVINQEYTNCEVLYLHVVDYNETAIRFYERNNFRTIKRLKNHYVIFEKNYDGLCLYKDIRVRQQNTTALESPRGYSSNDNERQAKSPRQIQQTQNDASQGILRYITSPIRFVYQKFLSNTQ